MIFDSAVCHGGREADLAIARLVGGFGRGGAAYEAAWPLPRGSRERVDLHNLHHVLNHANLFGGGCALQGRELMERLPAQLRSERTCQ